MRRSVSSGNDWGIMTAGAHDLGTTWKIWRKFCWPNNLCIVLRGLSQQYLTYTSQYQQFVGIGQVRMPRKACLAYGVECYDVTQEGMSSSLVGNGSIHAEMINLLKARLV